MLLVLRLLLLLLLLLMLLLLLLLLLQQMLPRISFTNTCKYPKPQTLCVLWFGVYDSWFMVYGLRFVV